MAEDSDQEKTEEPTSKRLEDAKKKGQIARSREFNTFAMLMASAALLMVSGKQMGNSLLNMMRGQFQLDRATLFDPTSPAVYFKQLMIDGVLLMTPFLIIMVIVAIVAPLALGGWIFNWDAITPKFEKLDPIAGIGRMFSMRGVVELAKSLLKFLLIAAVAIVLSNSFQGALVGLGSEPLEQSITHALDITGMCYLVLCASLILVVMFDVPYQLWDHHNKLKMTLQEIKDESKESEGNPEIKSRQRKTQMNMAQNRMMAQVPSADVIITNPSHYAVALRYDQEANNAPKLIAKGVDLIAAQIRLTANGANVPLVESPRLARALYYSTDIDKEIPAGLYLAVAQVLAYIYQLRAARENHWDEPPPPVNIKVPDEFKQGA